MKKIIFLSAFFLNLFALSPEEKYLLYNLFFKLLDKPIIKIYSTDIKNLDFNNFILVKECKKSDIVIGIDKNCSKPQFVLNYYDYKNHKNVIGAFYWRKGRPQIRLRKDLLIKYHLHITNDMKDFLE